MLKMLFVLELKNDTFQQAETPITPRDRLAGPSRSVLGPHSGQQAVSGRGIAFTGMGWGGLLRMTRG